MSLPTLWPMGIPGDSEAGAIMTRVKRTLRVYADTSVFGGCFDDEFRVESVRFFEEVRSGRFVLVVSDVTLDELGLAPESVRRVLAVPPHPVLGGIERAQTGVWTPASVRRPATTRHTLRRRRSSAPSS